MNKKLLTLINLWDDYENIHPDADLEDFFRYNLQKKTQKEEESLNGDINKLPLDIRLGRSLSIVYKLSNFYAKKALAPLKLNNIDDFLYLMSLSRQQSLTKSELINHYITEFTSGIEVIKRLVNQGFVEEFADEEDKRSTRLKITEIGKVVLSECYPVLTLIWELTFFKLSEDEKKVMYPILQKLEQHHMDLYGRLKNKDFEFIKKAFIEPDSIRNPML